MSWHNDVMIPDGIGQEIRGLRLVRQTDQLLGAAEVGLRLILNETALGHEIPRQVARHFEDGHGSL